MGEEELGVRLVVREVVTFVDQVEIALRSVFDRLRFGEVQGWFFRQSDGLIGLCACARCGRVFGFVVRVHAAVLRPGWQAGHGGEVFGYVLAEFIEVEGLHTLMLSMLSSAVIGEDVQRKSGWVRRVSNGLPASVVKDAGGVRLYGRLLCALF